jgi:dynein heavy chain
MLTLILTLTMKIMFKVNVILKFSTLILIPTLTLGDDLMLVSPSLEQLGKVMDRVISETVDVVGSFGVIFSSPEMEMYVMPDGTDEESETIEKVELGASIRGNALFIGAKDVIHRHLRHAFYAVKEYTGMFEPYRQLFLDNMQDSTDVSEVFACGEVEAFMEAIAAYKAQIDQFREVPRFADVGVIFVDSDDMRARMIPSPLACLQAIKNWLPDLAQVRAQELLDTVGAMNPVIASEPSTVEAYVNKKRVKDAANEGADKFRDQQSYVRSLVNVLDDNQWSIPDNVKALLRMLSEGLVALETNIQLADSKEEEEVKKFSGQVNEDCPKVIKRIAECREQLDTGFLADPDTPDEKAIKYLGQIEIDFEKAKTRTLKLQEYQTILKMPIDDFEVLEAVTADLNLKVRFWNDKAEWAKLRQTIMDSPMSELDVTMLERELSKCNKTVFLATKGLPNNKVVPKFKASVEQFNPVLPLVMDLRNPCLKDRHWAEINALTGVDIQGSIVPIEGLEPADQKVQNSNINPNFNPNHNPSLKEYTLNPRKTLDLNIALFFVIN